MVWPSDLQYATQSSSVNGLYRFENPKKFNYLRRKVSRKVLKGSSASLSGICRLDLHGRTKVKLTEQFDMLTLKQKFNSGARVKLVLCHGYPSHALREMNSRGRLGSTVV